jgi:choline dehydrogenase-like flavoprotein
MPIVVNFEDKRDNGFGVAQKACTDCGDCITGCNVSAKNTPRVKYLPMAHRAGAEIYTQTKVELVEKLNNGGWKIHDAHYVNPKQKESFTLEASHVIIAAGSINSTEILLRSEMHGLRASPHLGSGFSGNGDFFGVSYNGDLPSFEAERQIGRPAEVPNVRRHYGAKHGGLRPILPHHRHGQPVDQSRARLKSLAFTAQFVQGEYGP